MLLMDIIEHYRVDLVNKVAISMQLSAPMEAHMA